MKIKFLPQGLEVELDSDKSVMQVAHENGIPIRSVCKGVPSCAECRVKVVEGENNVLPPTKAEINLIGSTYFVDQRRLSCQLRCFGDVTIDTIDHLGKDDGAHKKIRGVKHTSLPQETRAVQGTMVLEDTDSAAWGPDSDLEDSSEKNSSPRSDAQRQGRDSGGGGGGKRKRKRSRRPKGPTAEAHKASDPAGGPPKKKSKNRRGNRRRPQGKPSAT